MNRSPGVTSVRGDVLQSDIGLDGVDEAVETELTEVSSQLSIRCRRTYSWTAEFGDNVGRVQEERPVFDRISKGPTLRRVAQIVCGLRDDGLDLVSESSDA